MAPNVSDTARYDLRCVTLDLLRIMEFRISGDLPFSNDAKSVINRVPKLVGPFLLDTLIASLPTSTPTSYWDLKFVFLHV